MNLLGKTRCINSVLQAAAGKPVDFKDVAKILSEVIECRTFVISRKGKILGYFIDEPLENEQMKRMLKEDHLPIKYIQTSSSISEASFSYSLSNEHSNYPIEEHKTLKNVHSTVIPIIGGGERLGTLLLERMDKEFQDEDIILGEYGATVVGMEILREKGGRIEEGARNKVIVRATISSLSHSELEAIAYIFEELEGTEGLLVTSKIADRIGLTRSVIVNALRKLESSGVIDSRSLGMKGTYLKVRNIKFLEELKNMNLTSSSRIS